MGNVTHYVICDGGIEIDTSKAVRVRVPAREITPSMTRDGHYEWRPSGMFGQFLNEVWYIPAAWIIPVDDASPLSESGAPEPKPSEGTAELIERLIVANVKLYMVCDEKARLAADPGATKEALRANAAKDVALCKSRAAIRTDLNARLGGEASGESVKQYGDRALQAAFARE
jgi:hypothetical protein